MDELCEFTFLDGPCDVTREEPIQYFVDRGIYGPYKRWISFHDKVYTILPGSKNRLPVNKTETNMLETTSFHRYILDFMNRQEEPFDGFAGFS